MSSDLRTKKKLATYQALAAAARTLASERGPDDVTVVDPKLVFRSGEGLVQEVRKFLATLEARTFHPRKWILEHATPQHAISGWEQVLKTFQRDFVWPSASVLR